MSSKLIIKLKCAGPEYKLKCEPTDTIRAIKNKLKKAMSMRGTKSNRAYVDQVWVVCRKDPDKYVQLEDHRTPHNLGIDEDHVLHLCLNATVSVHYRNEVVQTIGVLSCTTIGDIKSMVAPKVQTMIPEFSSISTAKIQDHMMLFNVDGVQVFDDGKLFRLPSWASGFHIALTLEMVPLPPPVQSPRWFDDCV